MDQAVLKARAGNISGVAHIDEEWMSTLASAGLIKDLGSFVDEGRYPEVVRKCGKYQSRRYGMPWTQSAIGIVTNRSFLQAAGVDASAVRTIDDFTKVLRKLKSADKQLVPYAPCTSVEQLKDIIPWMWPFGSRIVKGRTVTLGDTGSVGALEYWKRLLDDGLIQGGMERIHARTLFAQERAAMYDDAPQAIGVIPSQARDKHIASRMHPILRPSGQSTGRSLVWSQPLVTFDNRRSDRKLMDYLSTDLTALKSMFEGPNAQPPALADALEASWFRSNPFYRQWDRLVMSHSARNPFWSFPSAPAAQTVFYEAVDRALNGSASPATALGEAKEELQGMLTG